MRPVLTATVHVQVFAIGLLHSHLLLTILQVGEGLTKLAYESGLDSFPITVLEISYSQLMLEPIDTPIILAIFNGYLEISQPVLVKVDIVVLQDCFKLPDEILYRFKGIIILHIVRADLASISHKIELLTIPH
ncbi:hypothetical protein G6F33_013751 [Rhizopus arrhizus]|nr:hypothetical protein G6F24_014606 [Rhizopus arrhizus]KAG0894610.1 hypothetical protein G6F33_013751 [Rhizopus arrhizus]KAG0923997.1 hypothetical protein G6F32_014074 [Rhizopus arrhizus]KAG1271686.1 hypothetical protein G6F66_013507 [Rhizopus arrhizus]